MLAQIETLAAYYFIWPPDENNAEEMKVYNERFGATMTRTTNKPTDTAREAKRSDVS